MNFINWREEQALPGAKPPKVPFNAQTGERIDPHNPSNWLTLEQAQATGANIGIVLTDDDPYFLLDLDNCREPTTGSWTPGAVEIMRHFPGAAMEVSFNQTGGHIMGCCVASHLGKPKHRFVLNDVECEWYCTGRFVALGHGFTGDIRLDWTPKLIELLPQKPAGDETALVDGPVPEYGGTNDDDKLIEIMLGSRGSAKAVFGHGATFGDLWTKNVNKLALAYPTETPGKEFDASAADQALFNHLAFYTGKDAGRMDRLYRRSGLMRDKYEQRPEYRTWSISEGIRICKNVYKQRSVNPITGAPPGMPAAAPNYSEIMSVNEQIEYFKGCFYISSLHAVMVPGGNLLKPAQFKSVYGGHCFIMSGDGSKPTYNAFEAFTENRVHVFPKVRRKRFKPGLPYGEIIGDGVNCYVPEIIETVEGDVTPFLDLFMKLLPTESDREILMAWMASMVQNPGVKFLWSPVVQGVQGNGKSVLGEILFYSIGEKYSWSVKPQKVEAQFNAFVSNRTFINVEEMSMFNRYEMMNAIKDYITGTRQEVELKGVDSIMDPDYCANWFFTTNHKDAVIKERGDRRMAIFFTAQQTREDMIRDGMLTDNYFPKFWAWLRKEQGFAKIRHWLLKYPVPKHLDPAGDCFMAPETSSTGDAIYHSLTAVEQFLMEAIEAGSPGFRGGWVSTWAANKLLREVNKGQAPRKLASILENMGYSKVDRAANPIMQEDNTRPTLWCNGDATVAYEVAQGYQSPSLTAVNSG